MKLILLTLAFLSPQPTDPAAWPTDPAVWPLDPRPPIVRGFELPAKPWLPGHRGVDLSGSPGQPVRAAISGTITYAGQLAGRGVVVVSTGPRRTTYEPVVPAVTVGSAVQPGTILGHLSAAGSHCAPRTCLHWGLLQGGQYLNPLTLLPDRPVRLLPIAATSPAEVRTAYSSQPGQQTVRGELSGSPPSPRGERAATAVVATAAALTLAAGLMIRRH